MNSLSILIITNYNSMTFYLIKKTYEIAINADVTSQTLHITSRTWNGQTNSIKYWCNSTTNYRSQTISTPHQNSPSIYYSEFDVISSLIYSFQIFKRVNHSKLHFGSIIVNSFIIFLFKLKFKSYESKRWLLFYLIKNLIIRN